MRIGRMILGIWALLFASLGTSCRWPRTELVIGLATNMNLARVDLNVLAGDALVIKQAETGLDGGVLHTAETYGVVFTTDKVPTVDIEVIGRSTTHENGPIVVTQTRRVSPLHGHTQYLQIELLDSCAGMTCSESETCDHGHCVPREVDPATLPCFVEGADMAAGSPANSRGM